MSVVAPWIRLIQFSPNYLFARKAKRIPWSLSISQYTVINAMLGHVTPVSDILVMYAGATYFLSGWNIWISQINSMEF